MAMPLGPSGFNSPNIAQRHALHVERTAGKAVMLSDRVELSSAEARVDTVCMDAVNTSGRTPCNEAHERGSHQVR